MYTNTDHEEAALEQSSILNHTVNFTTVLQTNPCSLLKTDPQFLLQDVSQRHNSATHCVYTMYIQYLV